VSVLSVRGETWDVPEEIPTISEALELAEPQDTILVSPGEYEIEGPMTVETPSIVLLSEEPLGAVLLGTGYNAPMFTFGADSCTIDGFSMNQVSFERILLVDRSIRFTRIIGNRIDGLGISAGMDDEGTNTQVIGNDFIECVYPLLKNFGGPGLFASNNVSSCLLGVATNRPLEIRDNVIVGNRGGSDVGEPTHGGGIWIGSVSARVEITGNYLCDNWASGFAPPEPGWQAEGGGIWIGSCDSVLIEDNEIINNQATFGAGLYGKDSNIEVRDNFFWANYDSANYETNPARGSGGGLYLTNCTGVVESNTIVGNTALIDGGGIFIEGLSSPEFGRNIIASNRSMGVGVFCQDSAPSFECNDSWANTMANYGGDCPDPTGLNGNISADPMFCYPDTGNFHLLPESPCTEENSPFGCGLIGAYQVGCNAAGLSEEVLNLPSPRIRVFPNPAHRGTLVFLVLDQTTQLQSLGIFDVVGRRVRSIALGDASNRGRFAWDGRSESGHRVPSGVYFIRLSSGASEGRARLLIIE
jgi:hypothetical protein